MGVTIHLCSSKVPVPALRVMTGHQDVVEDVAWHMHHNSIFASVGDDKAIMFWDSRNDGQWCR